LDSIAEFIQIALDIRAHGGGKRLAGIFIIGVRQNVRNPIDRSGTAEDRIDIGICNIHGHGRTHRSGFSRGKSTGLRQGRALLPCMQREVGVRIAGIIVFRNMD